MMGWTIERTPEYVYFWKEWESGDGYTGDDSVYVYPDGFVEGYSTLHGVGSTCMLTFGEERKAEFRRLAGL